MAENTYQPRETTCTNAEREILVNQEQVNQEHVMGRWKQCCEGLLNRRREGPNRQRKEILHEVNPQTNEPSLEEIKWDSKYTKNTV